MPKAYRKWSGLGLIVLLLAACTTGQSLASQYPVTPTSSPITSTQVPPQRTLEPTMTPEPPVFDELEINLITDLNFTEAEYDQAGWPTSLSMPTEEVLFYAIQCANMDSVKSGFFRPQNIEDGELILSQSCTGKSELLLVSPNSVAYSIGWLEDGMYSTKEEYFLRKGMEVDYTAFDMKGYKIFIWYVP